MSRRRKTANRDIGIMCNSGGDQCNTSGDGESYENSGMESFPEDFVRFGVTGLVNLSSSIG